MSYYAKDGSLVREASDDAPRMTQGDAWEASQRVSKGLRDWEVQEKQRKEAERQERAEFYEINKRVEQQRMDALNYELNQQKAVRIIVEQERKKYYDQSFLKRAFDTIRGKSFANRRNEIEEYAMNRVDKMSSGYLERFIEDNSEEKGRSR